MKNIKYILAIAIMAIFAIACTDEEQLNDSKSNKVNNKDLDKSGFSSLSPYPEYEEIDITDQEAMDLLVDFNKAMNNEIEMPDMEVKKALLAMEMYFNYAIVDKNVNYDIKESYLQQEFEFAVNLNDTIKGTELKTNYRNFLIGIKNTMANKFLKFSDMFVSSKTSTTITFKIIIPPFIGSANDLNAAVIPIPSCPVVREVGDIPDVPEDVIIDWGVYFEGWSNPSFANFPYFYDNYQGILNNYCLKKLDYMVYGITAWENSDYLPSIQGFRLYEYYFLTQGSGLGMSFDHQFNYEEIMSLLIPKTLIEADNLRQLLNEGESLLNITPVAEFPYFLDMYYTPGCGALRICKYLKGNVIPSISVDNIFFIP